MKKGMLVLFSIVLFAVSGVSQAAEDQKESRTEIAPQPEKKGVVEEKRRQKVPTMKQVLVSATKTEEERKDIANSVIYKDELDIEGSPAKTLGELLANELGVDWRSYGNYGGAPEEIHIRGMSGNATQVFVNGMSINSPSLGAADVSRIPMNNIERIEVIKGSGSVLHGSGAMGGAVFVYTKRPQKGKIDLKATAGYGTQDTYRFSAEQGMFIWDGLGYYLTANYLSTGGFRRNSGLDHRDVSARLVYEKGALLDVSLYGDYIDRFYGVPGVKPPKKVDDFYFEDIHLIGREEADLQDRGGDKDARVVLEVKSDPLKWLGLRLRADYTRMENYFYNRWYRYPYTSFFPFFVVAPGVEGMESWTTNTVRGIEANVNVRPIEGANVLLGVEHKDLDWKNEGVDLDDKGHRQAGTKVRSAYGLHTTGVFAEAQYRPCKYFKGITGLRYEAHSQFGDETLPRFGIIVNPFEDTAIKASTGRHYRAPTLNDLYWPFIPGMGGGNRDLKPEKGWHTDITIEQSLFDDKVFLTASYFHWDVKNKILWEPDATGAWIPTNLGKYKADGLEVGSKIGPFYNMTLDLSYTYTHAKEKARDFTKQQYPAPAGPFWPATYADFRYEWKERRASFTPRSLFKAALTYESDFGLTATATARYVGNRFWYRTETYQDYPFTHTVRYGLDSYWTVDLKADQRLFDHWIFSVQANNLLDRKYTTYLSSFRDPNYHPNFFFGRDHVAGYPGAGRSFFFTVTYEH